MLKERLKRGSPLWFWVGAPFNQSLVSFPPLRGEDKEGSTSELRILNERRYKKP